MSIECKLYISHSKFPLATLLAMLKTSSERRLFVTLERKSPANAGLVQRSRLELPSASGGYESFALIYNIRKRKPPYGG
jgi:hypothetical protein